ncbi:unnamed protein product [Meganyctiphanes norvegica]|uniref:Uncharacterized protein n=1 Tax=Meganyctiphanes norvegica TaxID=48144 RepID=A0AAV2PUW9_MEGNR
MLRPKEVRSLMDSMSATVGTPAKAILDREMTPILAELMTLKNKNHSAFEQLFKWLVDPQRTGEEFYYIIGPLRQHVAKIMQEHFRQYVFNVDCLIKVAMEALAVKCPTLEGPWELAAWTLVSESELYYKVWELESGLFTKEDFGPVSDHFSNWIICVIGDPDLCPNPYLRIELVSLLLLVDLGLHNCTHAFESLLAAFDSVDLDYLQDSLCLAILVLAIYIRWISIA